MSISEFKDKVNLITSFVARLNEEAIPNDIKKTMVKIYANTLRINLTERMVDSLIELRMPACALNRFLTWFNPELMF